ncbi:hypothetical protein GCM10022205_55880 [Spinactinospora alkalitolerans]
MSRKEPTGHDVEKGDDILPSPADTLDANAPSLRSGALVTLFCIAAMLAMTWSLWDRLPELITTRRETEYREATEVPRWIISLATPAALILVAGLLPLSFRLEGLVERGVGHQFGGGRRNKSMRHNLILIVLSPVFTTVHVAVLLFYAGQQIPVMTMVTIALGALIAVVGNFLPKIASGRPRSSSPESRRLLEAWRSSHRVGGWIMMAVGALTILLAPFLNQVALTFLVPFAVLIPFISMGIRTAVSLRR